MKRVMLLAVGASCLLAGMAVPANAQFRQTMMLRSKVPFAFISGDRTVQAGEYSIEIKQRLVRFIDANGHPAQTIFSNPQQASGSEEKPRLVFHKYGDAYFLWQIWTGEHKADFRMSRTEYNLRAGLKADQDTVILAMR
jgi:hypothetical protein